VSNSAPARLTPSFEHVQDSISSLVTAAEAGTAGAPEAWFSTLYAQLHRLARRELGRGGGCGVSLGVTTLLHEAYLGMSGGGCALDFPDEARFMAYAARVMRGLIIDHARSRGAQKRGGRFVLTTLEPEVAVDAADQGELGQISDALDELARFDPFLAQIVDLKFFCGFSFPEIAAMHGVSERTAQRSWEKARLHLHRTIRAESLRDGR
jgi:RNA polymerase sigma factor (TIGR02999 family)